VAIVLAGVGGTALALHMWYGNNLKPVSSQSETEFFTVESGSGVHVIAVNLQQSGLIRSSSAFETYVTANNYRDKLQAGTYKLSPSMSVQTIVAKFVDGDVAHDLLTILPGKNLREIQQAFKEAGYNSSEIKSAFSPAAYANHPALASLPKGKSLEGYLYPDSFQKQSNTPASVIVRQALDEMNKHLTQDVINGFGAQNLNTFEGITLASIIAKETDNPADQPFVAQVLLTRLADGMLLQADATAHFASDMMGQPRSLSVSSPYNTYVNQGLPPGPISNVTKEALYAAAHPAKTDYVYYFTGKDCKMHYTKTLDEHNAAIAKYGVKSCSP
ncbi:MAG TPA: endolytic transglycosylase MltG, partial [Candidatus Saccharimonadales bacterium]|nr:endolytic transglycosylase MltG [Candidatus Saccharimonadales bacterium]